MHSIVFQAGFVVPLLVLLIAYAMTKPDKSGLRWLLSGVLIAILGYVISISIQFGVSDPTWRVFGRRLGQISVCLITPFFVLTLARYVRVPLIEEYRTTPLVVGAPFAFFALAFLTNDQHQWMFTQISAGIDEPDPIRSAGPLFWVFQLWTYVFIMWGVGVVLRMLISAPAPDDRPRAALLLAAIAFPMIAHTLYLAGWPPMDYPLTPAALGLTAVFLVAGISRYGLLEELVVVRRDVIDYLSDGLVLATAEGFVLDVNPAAALMLGSGLPDLRGSHLDQVLDSLAPSGPDGETHVVDVVSDEEPRPAEIILHDGRHIEVSAGFVRAHDDQPAGRFMVLRDRTDQRRSEGLLRQRQKLESLGILAAGVAHEVNNPLAFVRANLVHLQQLAGELQVRLKMDGQGPAGDLEEIPEVVDESLVGLDRIGRIVDGLLRLSRAPSEALGRVDVNTVVAEAVRYAALHRNPQVSVKTDLADGLPTARGSADRLIQVILNLLLNAKQALSERDSGTVCVETGLGDDGVSLEIRVRDDGPGIAEEFRERIFDPFFTTRGPGEGTGLGLSIAYDIVRELGGMLSVSSRVGEGACFVIRLPLSTDGASP